MNTQNEIHGNPEKDRDTRPEALISIWSATLVVLGTCVVLGAVLKSASIPFLVIALAVLATVYVLGTGQRAADRSEAREVEALRRQVKDLEERLANVEVINKYGERLAEKEKGDSGEGIEESGEREI